MSCIDIVYKNWPEDLEIWIRVEKKLHAIKTDGLSGPAKKISNSELDPEEREVLNNLLQYLVNEYEKKHGPLEKYGPPILVLALRELVEILT